MILFSLLTNSGNHGEKKTVTDLDESLHETSPKEVVPCFISNWLSVWSLVAWLCSPKVDHLYILFSSYSRTPVLLYPFSFDDSFYDSIAEMCREASLGEENLTSPLESSSVPERQKCRKVPRMKIIGFFSSFNKTPIHPQVGKTTEKNLTLLTLLLVTSWK